MVSFSSEDKNSQIKGNVAAPIIVEKTVSHLRSDFIDLAEEDDDDRIPLKEMLSRFMVFYAIAFPPLSLPLPSSLALSLSILLSLN